MSQLALAISIVSLIISLWSFYRTIKLHRIVKFYCKSRLNSIYGMSVNEYMKTKYGK